MRILLVTAGSHGDINPFIGIGRALRERGHEAVLLANPYYRSQVEEAGVAFEPMGEYLDLRKVGEDYPDIMHPRRGGRIVLNALLIPGARDGYRRILELAPSLKPDIVLHHFVCLGAPWACEKIGVPCATAILSPINWLARGDRLAPMSWSPLNSPMWLTWSMFALLKPIASWILDRPLNAARKELGLPPARDILFRAMRGGDINLGLWSPTFRPPCEGDPPRGRICGFCWHDRHGEAERDRESHAGGALEDVRRFIDDGEPPILFCLGSAAVHVAGDFYEHAAEACRLLGRRGLLLVGPSRDAPSNMPKGTRAFPYAPFSWVMPRCAVNIHHGGVGSTGQALLAGRPTVVIPHAHDQFDNAARVKRLGVSETVRRPRVTAERLATAIRAVLRSSRASEAAAQIGKRMNNENGAAEVVKSLEKMPRRG